MSSPEVKTPVVCVHGFSGSWRNWVPVVPQLEQHHDVRVARLAGHSRGPQLDPGQATVAAVADALERDLDRAGIDRAHLVGNSLGGWLSLELAARGRALSVMALSPALGWEPHGKHLKTLETKLKVGRRLYSSVAPYAETALSSALVRRVLLNGAIAHAERTSAVEAAAFIRDNLRCSVYFELMQSFLTTTHTLGPIGCPVHIAWSEKDALIPADPYGARFPELVPSAEFSTVPDVGHVPTYDNPQLVADTILQWIARIDPSHPDATAPIAPTAPTAARTGLLNP